MNFSKTKFFFYFFLMCLSCQTAFAQKDSVRSDTLYAAPQTLTPEEENELVEKELQLLREAQEQRQQELQEKQQIYYYCLSYIIVSNQWFDYADILFVYPKKRR